MKIFKICSCCGNPWHCRDEFLRDANIDLIGYQANFYQLELGYFLFNHLICESTIAINAGFFKNLYTGPVFDRRLTGTEFCQGFCEDVEILDPCDEKCDCAYVRDVIQTIKDWPKEKHRLTKAAQG
jgi:hypothetical protein